MASTQLLTEKQRKRMRQLKAQGKLVSDEEHQAQQQAIRNSQAVNRSRGVLRPDDKLPEDLKVSYLSIHEPEMLDFMLNKDVQISISKQQDRKLVRALWYYGLDKSHSFDAKHRNARANWSAMMQGVANGDSADAVPAMMRLYWVAMFEHDREPESYTRREAFIEYWLRTGVDEDIHVFTPAEVKRIKRLHKAHKEIGAAKIARDFDASDAMHGASATPAFDIDSDEEDDDGEKQPAADGDAEMSGLADELSEVSAVGKKYTNPLDEPDWQGYLATLPTEQERMTAEKRYCIRILDHAEAALTSYQEAGEVMDKEEFEALTVPVWAAVDDLQLREKLVWKGGRAEVAVGSFSTGESNGSH